MGNLLKVGLAAALSLAAAPAIPAQLSTLHAGGLAASAPPISATCAATNNGVTAYFCADFANGSYVLNGVSYSSFTAMGGTVPAGCTIAGGTGVSCIPTNILSIPAGNPASDYMMVTNATDNPAGGDTSNATISSSGNFLLSYWNPGYGRAFLGAGAACAATSGAAGTDAAYVPASGDWVTSVYNTTAVTCPTNPNPAASSTLTIGGNVTLPYYVSSVRIYVGVFTGAQVQTATTH